MTASGLLRFLLFLGILFLIDLYAWKGISTALPSLPPAARRVIKWVYWTISAGMLVAVVYVGANFRTLRNAHDHSTLFTLFGLLVLFLLPKLVLVIFHGVEDLAQAVRWAWAKATEQGPSSGEGISRMRFLSQIGLAAASVPFFGVLYGITRGRGRFHVAEMDITAKGLPKAFDGLRIVQISDMHLGSFAKHSDIVQHGVDLINEQRPDLILFTGDLVNDFADEAAAWIPTLQSLQARIGKFSILGNHDYSDYVEWDSAKDKTANLDLLKQYHADAGFKLLLDEHVRVSDGADHFALVGVQNWGVRFQKYGDLRKALTGTEGSPYRLLMSHDPTHWDAEVRGKGVGLMLSGHTHGAQFGINILGRTYSPAQWFYKQWAGLYSEGDEHLYVNRGFGFIGFPGRVGMPPEITVLTLRSA
ncbi:MAG: metallophosphoesterase [Flavobacteriales bacterium]